DRSVRLDLHHETIEVGSLSNTGLLDDEVGAPNRIVDRVDTHQIRRHPARYIVLFGQDEATSLVYVELHPEIAVFLELQDVVILVDHRDRSMVPERRRAHRPRLAGAKLNDRLIHPVLHLQDETL